MRAVVLPDPTTEQRRVRAPGTAVLLAVFPRGRSVKVSDDVGVADPAQPPDHDAGESAGFDQVIDRGRPTFNSSAVSSTVSTTASTGVPAAGRGFEVTSGGAGRANSAVIRSR